MGVSDGSHQVKDDIIIQLLKININVIVGLRRQNITNLSSFDCEIGVVKVESNRFCQSNYNPIDFTITMLISYQ